jgi:hypothetical protein
MSFITLKIFYFLTQRYLQNNPEIYINLFMPSNNLKVDPKTKKSTGNPKTFGCQIYLLKQF